MLRGTGRAPGGEALRFLMHFEGFTFGFAQPALHGLATRRWIDPGAVAVVEVAAREPLTPPPEFRILDERVYGAARLVFLRVSES